MEAFSQRKIKSREILRQLHKDRLLTRRRSAVEKKAHPEVLMGASQAADTTSALTCVPTAIDPFLQKLQNIQRDIYYFSYYFQTWRQDKALMSKKFVTISE